METGANHCVTLPITTHQSLPFHHYNQHCFLKISMSYTKFFPLGDIQVDISNLLFITVCFGEQRSLCRSICEVTASNVFYCRGSESPVYIRSNDRVLGWKRCEEPREFPSRRVLWTSKSPSVQRRGLLTTRASFRNLTAFSRIARSKEIGETKKTV